MTLNLVDLLYIIHPKTFQIIENSLNASEISIPENLQGLVIKIAFPPAPYYLLIFLLDKELSLNFITDHNANISGIDIDLEIHTSPRGALSLFTTNSEDFCLFKLHNIKLVGNKKIFIPFKKWLDSLELITKIPLIFQEIALELNLEQDFTDNILSILVGSYTEENNQIQLSKKALKKIKEEKIQSLASFKDNFQIYSQKLGLLDNRLLSIQARQLLLYGKLENFLKKLNSLSK